MKIISTFLVYMIASCYLCYMRKLLIGGQALRELGSDRYTDDVDYMVNDLSTTESFIHTNEDLVNANGHKFFSEVWEMEADNSGEIASPQALLELCAFSFAQHCRNFNFAKADAKEYDIKFLVRNFDLKALKIASKHLSAGELSEIQKVINSVKK